MSGFSMIFWEGLRLPNWRICMDAMQDRTLERYGAGPEPDEEKMELIEE